MGAEKKLSLGAYPEISLKEARELREAARSNLAKGADPAEQKQRDKRAALISAANSFEAVAKAYIANNRRDGLAEATVRKREWFLDIVRKRLCRSARERVASSSIDRLARVFVFPFLGPRTDRKKKA